MKNKTHRYYTAGKKCYPCPDNSYGMYLFFVLLTITFVAILYYVMDKARRDKQKNGAEVNVSTRYYNHLKRRTQTTIIFRKRVNAATGIRSFYAHGSEKSSFVRDKGEICVLHKQP